MFATPVDMGTTTPEPPPIVAIAVLLLVHKPPPVASVKVMDEPPVHNTVDPEMATELTVIKEVV